ncbi:(2Fe-2S)-binding protein [Proteinivorax hydrogeniformans]|uniref:(2Fe-2S)-binding protein n=1 Tax=Proteinivorax hydrogeniformans TaxID=1826727 RepID=A0AAU8HWG3_9FIRM
MRIEKHPIKSFKRGEEISFYYNGEAVTAFQGETIAAALHAAGHRQLTKSQKYGRDRGLFCAIGKCSACLMVVDNVPNTPICTTKAKPGMKVFSK